MKRISCFKTRQNLKLISSLVIFLMTTVSQAREWSRLYNNPRTTAMGGTQVAVTSDDTSLFRNPAGLGSFRGMYAMVLDPEIEGSEKFQSQFPSTLTDLKKVRDLLNSDRDKYYHAKLQLTPTFSLRNFSFGLIYKNEISALMNSAGTQMDTIYHNDMGAFAAFNYSLWDGRIKFGVTGKAINRIEIDNATLDPNGSLDVGTIGSEGTGYGADVGLTLQAPIAYLPTLSVVARDVGDMKFDSSSGMRLSTTTRPLVSKQMIDVGFSLNPIFSREFRGTFALEYRDVSDVHQEDFVAKRTHVGLELCWRDVFYTRFGMNQNYWTAGLEIAGERWSWQLSSYGEEVGTSASPREDRRYSTRIGLRF